MISLHLRKATRLSREAHTKTQIKGQEESWEEEQKKLNQNQMLLTARPWQRNPKPVSNVRKVANPPFRRHHHQKLIHFLVTLRCHHVKLIARVLTSHASHVRRQLTNLLTGHLNNRKRKCWKGWVMGHPLMANFPEIRDRTKGSWF